MSETKKETSPKAGILDKLCQVLGLDESNLPQKKAYEAYLEKATDVQDLEIRQRTWERSDQNRGI